MKSSVADKTTTTKPTTSTMESYIQFWQNPNAINLTVDQLNQIISMHGFKKIHKRPKKELVTALSSIDLTVPYRSTLKESVSSFASLPLDQINDDLSFLNWNECSVQFVETVGSMNDNDQKICNVEEEIGSCVGKKKKKKKKMKMKKKKRVMEVRNVEWSVRKKRSERMVRRQRCLLKLDALALAALVAAATGGGGGGGSSGPAATASSRASYSDGSC